MTFTKPSVSLTPIKDAVFTAVARAKEDIALHGSLVVNATIGSLYDEDGNLATLNSFYHHFDQIPHHVKAAYASAFEGTPEFRQEIYNWYTQGRELDLCHHVIATPGGTGAIAATFNATLEAGQTLILPDLAWGSYKVMADLDNYKVATYRMFSGDHFNLQSFKETCLATMNTQDRLLIVINDPCHNPSGYSMSSQEWKEVITFLNECATKVPVILLNDVAYIDYGFDQNKTRDYMLHFNDIHENLLVVVSFSCSKTCTAYGLRLGAAILLGKNDEKVSEVNVVLTKLARARWSNVNNAAMSNFVWATTLNKDAFISEKQVYVDLLRQRGTNFYQEALEVGLPTYPFKEGFFVTLNIQEPLLSQYYDKLVENHIHTIKLGNGIRVGICSISVAQSIGLATQMKKILDDIQPIK